MKPRLITAFASLLPDGGLPGEIVYLPEGEHAITPFVDGKPQKITVRVPAAQGAQIAASLQADMEKRQAGNVRPWFDFEHKSGASSALPMSFRYEPGKGVMCAVEWTGAGKAAIEGKDFSYFSPTFLIAEDGTPAGLPERGPLGALVNEPAFREIPRIAASDAVADPETNPISTMSKLIFAALAISAAHADAETLAVQAIDTMKTDAEAKKKRIAELECELADLKKAKDSAEAKCAEATKARLTGLVEVAVTAGKIAPKDDTTKTQALSFLEANEALGTSYLDALPVKFADLTKPLVNASTKTVDSGDKFAGKTGLQLLEAALSEELETAK